MIKHSEVSEKILKAYYVVFNELGFGFEEKVYRKSLLVELRLNGLSVAEEYPISVTYKGQNVGNYFADLVVEEKIILELKVAQSLHPAHSAQLNNYLRATLIEVGLLLNFGSEKPEFKRHFYSNQLKK
jgi:GxxExxY protein